MELSIACESRTIMVEKVKTIGLVVNGGLTIGISPDGLSICITPQGLPTLVSDFHWNELLTRLLTEGK